MGSPTSGRITEAVMQSIKVKFMANLHHACGSDMLMTHSYDYQLHENKHQLFQRSRTKQAFAFVISLKIQTSIWQVKHVC